MLLFARCGHTWGAGQKDKGERREFTHAQTTRVRLTADQLERQEIPCVGGVTKSTAAPVLR